MSCRSLFYASTSYHILLALNVIKSDDIQEASLVFRPISETHKAFLEDTKELISDYFEEVFIDDGLYSHNVLKRLKTKVKEARITAKRYAEDIDPDYIYTSKDRDHLIQSIINEANTKKNFYVEDGMTAYDCFRFERQSKLKLIAKKIAFGQHYDDITVYGNSVSIDECLLTHPSYAKSEISTRVKKIRNNLTSLIKKEKEKLKDVLALESDVNNIEVIILLQHSSKLTDDGDYLKYVEEIMSEHKNYNLFVKYHPRESYPYMRKVSNVTSEIEPTIPVELLYALSNKLKKVYGKRSTALKSAKWMRNDMQVCTLLKKEYASKRIIDLFEGLGIQFVCT